MANVQKLERVLDYIRSHPEHHDQCWWSRRNSCGTTRCFAGTAVMLAGYPIDWSPLRAAELGEFLTTATCMVPRGHPGAVPTSDGKFFARIRTVAQRELDLTDEQAEALFFVANDVKHLETLVKDMANEQDLDDG